MLLDPVILRRLAKDLPSRTWLLNASHFSGRGSAVAPRSFTPFRMTMRSVIVRRSATDLRAAKGCGQPEPCKTSTAGAEASAPPPKRHAPFFRTLHQRSQANQNLNCLNDRTQTQQIRPMIFHARQTSDCWCSTVTPRPFLSASLVHLKTGHIVHRRHYGRNTQCNQTPIDIHPT